MNPVRLYDVKCDDCKTVLRSNASLRDSAAGGTCDECRAARLPQTFEKRQPVRHVGDRRIKWTVVEIRPDGVRIARHDGYRVGGIFKLVRPRDLTPWVSA